MENSERYITVKAFKLLMLTRLSAALFSCFAECYISTFREFEASAAIKEKTMRAKSKSREYFEV